jgi:hypothetical protein
MVKKLEMTVLIDNVAEPPHAKSRKRGSSKNSPMKKKTLVNKTVF